jgi:hypothetical protein
MDDLQFPPWRPDSTETVVSDQPAFHGCDEVIDTFAAKANATATNRVYTQSQQWGDVVRARVVDDNPNTSPTLITCWTGSGGGLQFVIQAEGYQ